jgi:hypothetical protein
MAGTSRAPVNGGGLLEQQAVTAVKSSSRLINRPLIIDRKTFGGMHAFLATMALAFSAPPRMGPRGLATLSGLQAVGVLASARSAACTPLSASVRPSAIAMDGDTPDDLIECARRARERGA